MSADLETLSVQLQSLTLGQRAWFWICPDIEDLPFLLLAPFRGDPLAIELQKRISGARVPADAAPVIGLCAVGEDGVFRFAAPTASKPSLIALAGWVKDNADVYPAFRRLYGARMLLVDERMNVELTIDGPDLWEGVEPTIVPGSIQDTIQTIHTLVPGEQAWFWATNRGPGGRPFLLIEPVRDGAKVRDLNRRVEGALRRSPALGTTVRGVIACGSDGILSVRTHSNERRANTVFRALGKPHRFLRWMLRPRGVPGDDLSATVRVLSGLQTKDRGFFFASLRPKEGEIVLFDTDKAGLKSQMKAASLTPAQGTVGRFRTREGGLDLAIHAEDPTLLPTVVCWVAQQQHQHTEIRRLIGSHLLVLDEEDNVTARVDGTRAWASF